ncbi:glycosyltransferase family 2 protein [Pistricoccus aurantiacus]
MPNVIAVILTYNRQELLQRCLDAVYSQTQPCSRVLVIDNASTDGTREMLNSLRLPNLEVHVLSRNLGAAGGFNLGFRLAYQKGADFIWMMDDDVIPTPEALERLCEAEGVLKASNTEYSYLLSAAFTEDGLATNTPVVDTSKNSIGYPDWTQLIEHGLIAIQRGTFVSILVPRATLATFGLPIASMFIWGEDTEFTLRVTRTTPGYLVGNSRVLHLRQKNGAVTILSEENPARIEYFKYSIRNNLYVAKKYSLFRQYAFLMLKDLNWLIRLLRRGQFQKAKVVMKGIIGSIGFSPQVEAADAPFDKAKATFSTFTPVRYELQAANHEMITKKPQVRMTS